jgi:hypothetical protein
MDDRARHYQARDMARGDRARHNARDDRARDAARGDRAEENRAYVRELLAERQPGLAALLRAVERQVDQDLAGDPCDWRRIMNTAWLYHLDGSVCVDHWSCQVLEHTSIPPRCGVRAGDEPIGCELPKGHPGPHLHFADLECCGAGDENPGAEDGSRTITGAVRRGHPAALAS